jgi:hypothetical protein
MSPGFRGGPNRHRILDELVRTPANAHQLAAALSLDYRTVRHHLRILERNGAVTRPVGDAYASPYELAPSTAAYLETLPGASSGMSSTASTARPVSRPPLMRTHGGDP